MRVQLVLDGISLSQLVYKDSKYFDNFNKKFTTETVGAASASNVTVDVNTMNTTGDVLDKIVKPITFYSSDVDAQCFSTQYEDGCCMVFRGTTSKQDWKINLDARLEPLELPKILGNDRPQVHQGFLRQFNSIKMSLLSHATDYMKDTSIKESNKTFYYFGHSLGGALATIASLVFGSLFPDARHVCITYGSPRVGNERFCSLFKRHVDECVRVVNQEDPVPLVPTACRFEHVYGVAYIDKDEKIHDEITENRVWNTCKDSMLCCCGIAENPKDDHDLTQYASAWKKISV